MSASPRSLPNSPQQQDKGKSKQGPAGMSAPHHASRRRAPLSELPIANFAPRPPSPLKQHVSPSKPKPSAKGLLGGNTGAGIGGPSGVSPMHASIMAAAVARNSSSSRPGSSSSSQASGSMSSVESVEDHMSSEKAEQPAGAAPPVLPALSQANGLKTPSTLSDLPLEESPSIEPQQKSPRIRNTSRLRGNVVPPSPSRSATVAAMAERLRREGQAKRRQDERGLDADGAALVTPPIGVDAGGPSAASIPQSLPRKKDRVRPDEVARFAMDRNRHDSGSVPSMASPSPQKGDKARGKTASTSMLAESPILDHDEDLAVFSDRSSINQGLGITTDLPSVSSKKTAVDATWNVFLDGENDEQERQTSTSSTPSSLPLLSASTEDDKENAKPDPVVLQGRRKGTGGRLSLVAQDGGEGAAGNSSIASSAGSMSASSGSDPVCEDQQGD